METPFVPTRSEQRRSARASHPQGRSVAEHPAGVDRPSTALRWPLRESKKPAPAGRSALPARRAALKLAAVGGSALVFRSMSLGVRFWLRPSSRFKDSKIQGPRRFDFKGFFADVGNILRGVRQHIEGGVASTETFSYVAVAFPNFGALNSRNCKNLIFRHAKNNRNQATQRN